MNFGKKFSLRIDDKSNGVQKMIGPLRSISLNRLSKKSFHVKNILNNEINFSKSD
jgi:hypothetical protein